MTSKKIIECVPNFCVGQNQEIISKIGNAISKVKRVELKCIDTGYAANRSVYTFWGEMESMFEAAYNSIKVALELIDMREHKGTHPRFGAVDVFPFVGIKNVPDEELVSSVNLLAKKISDDFKVPIYLYEKSAKSPERKDLAKIRKGEYEGLKEKINSLFWTPDFYPYFNEKSGAMAMGVRDVLVAFNVNLDTKNVEIAKRIAEKIRHSGKIMVDENGIKKRVHGLCSGVKAIGWYIRDFDKVQVSMNIVDVKKTPVHLAYKTCMDIAHQYGVNITGSELIGCIPRISLIEAGKYFAHHQSINQSYESFAVEYMNMNEVKPFDMTKNVIDL